ncbi:hypothetical protein BJ508DRAFT_330147 [Ascobolus immersus RN42]|uniref:Uncharacterized protein n=1 Tax=Ascobolus immersus RN42 TaxID=1160509 RepID=A0A3N4HUS0_ASCIM|nr:hypothetical protein BJ508DRAFT_330147 [Ascobolus immersus RN42]
MFLRTERLRKTVGNHLISRPVDQLQLLGYHSFPNKTVRLLPDENPYGQIDKYKQDASVNGLPALDGAFEPYEPWKVDEMVNSYYASTTGVPSSDVETVFVGNTFEIAREDMILELTKKIDVLNKKSIRYNPVLAANPGLKLFYLQPMTINFIIMVVTALCLVQGASPLVLASVLAGLFALHSIHRFDRSNLQSAKYIPGKMHGWVLKAPAAAKIVFLPGTDIYVIPSSFETFAYVGAVLAILWLFVTPRLADEDKKAFLSGLFSSSLKGVIVDVLAPAFGLIKKREQSTGTAITLVNVTVT